MRLTFAAAALSLALAAPAHAAADPARYMPAELIAESAAPEPGSTILVGFRMTPKPGWHGYWSNPGDSGIAPTVAWTAPEGVQFGPLLHPAPTLISADGISSYVHEGRHILLARMRLPASVGSGAAIPIEAKLNWAACTASQCVPLHATFTLDLVAGDGAKSPDAGALENAERALPKQAGSGEYAVEGNVVRLTLPKSMKVDPRAARFFPDENDAFQTGAARFSDGHMISAPFRVAPNNSITGVVTDGRSAYRIAFKPMSPAVASEAKTPARALAESPPDASTLPIPTPPAKQQPAPTTANDWRWLALTIVLVGLIASGLALSRRKPR
jgi:DsbC/DsbD-like thiol-disulfide interchange protein